jgi:hypothetical protein
MDAAGAERTQAALRFALFLGVFVMLVAAVPLIPALGHPIGFLVAAAAGALPTFAFLARRIGAGRAAVLACLVAAAFALGLMAFGFLAWATGG